DWEAPRAVAQHRYLALVVEGSAEALRNCCGRYVRCEAEANRHRLAGRPAGLADDLEARAVAAFLRHDQRVAGGLRKRRADGHGDVERARDRERGGEDSPDPLHWAPRSMPRRRRSYHRRVVASTKIARVLALRYDRSINNRSTKRGVHAHRPASP